MIDLADAPAVEPVKLRAAAEGVARKWRLFPGRMEWSKKVGPRRFGPRPSSCQPSLTGALFRTQDDRWAVRVPTGELPADYDLVNFSTVESADRCPVFFPKPSAAKNGMYPTVPDALSYAPGTPFDFKTMAKTSAPMVNYPGFHFHRLPDDWVCYPALVPGEPQDALSRHSGRGARAVGLTCTRTLFSR